MAVMPRMSTAAGKPARPRGRGGALSAAGRPLVDARLCVLTPGSAVLTGLGGAVLLMQAHVQGSC